LKGKHANIRDDFSAPVRLKRFGRYRDETEVNLGSFDAIDQLKPTYESWIIRREAWLPPFPLTIHHDRDRDVTRRFEE